MSPSPAGAPLDSTAPRALPRWRQPSLWLALLASLALAGLVGGRYVRRVAPGPLSAVHGRHDELNGSWDCSSCHGGLGESMAQACLECHGEIAQQMERKAGLHGALEAGLVEACARCHGEHHGEAFVPVNPRSFALAGFADLQQFDHAKVGYALTGGHADLACAKCHSNADSGELPRGGWRYLGQHQDCATCHADPHQGRMAPACSDCHTDRDWNESFLFAHDEFLPLIGGHAGQRCRDCHAADSPHALERQGHGRPATRAADRTATRPAANVRPAARRCADCHAAPHAGDFTAHAARLAATTPEQGCVTCHAADHASFRDPRATVTPEQHAAASLQLAAPHAELDCARCHDPAGADYAARYPGRAARDCAACHADPHGGQFEGSKQAPLGCVSCHDFRFFAPHTFTVGRHARTALPLAGAHREADCASCHEASRELKEAPPTARSASTVPRRFHGTEARCEECHADPHDGLFDARYRSPPPAAGSCARCHGTTAFDQLVTPLDHGRATGFALRGAHLQADCASCHPRLPTPDATGRTFARAQERFVSAASADALASPDRCATCHADPHDGAFSDFAPADGARARGCVDCHDEVSFRAASASFDHAAATGFPLDGAHGTAGCSDCHAPLPARDARGRTSAPALGNACGDCHDDPHAGQFVRDGENRCTPCHSPTADFSALFFQHNLHSTFRLDETHRAAACSACHPVFLHEEREVVRYRPLPSDCADCHGAPQEPLRRRRGRSG